VRYILNVPLANSTVDKTVQFTKDVLQHIDVSKLEAIEVGNEPNLYESQTWHGHFKRNPPYTPQEYVTELKKYTDAIMKNVRAEPPCWTYFSCRQSGRQRIVVSRRPVQSRPG
jgi:hypothetical protein